MISRRQAIYLVPWFGLGSALAQDSIAVGRAIAPSGTIRAIINVGNPLLANRLPGQPAPFGLSVDLALELGRRLALDVELVSVASAWRAVEMMRGEAGDIGFFPIDSTRGQGVEFTAPYAEVEGTYLVRQDSSIGSVEELDRRGVRIAVGLNSPHDLFLRRHIRAASMVRVANLNRVVEEFLRQGLDAAAGNRSELQAEATRLGGLRLLPETFMFLEFAMGVPADRPPAALAYVSSFIEELKANGFIAAALERHQLRAAAVSPPR
jgi:polar amino acid transport system substrate-binding protein